MRRPVLEEGCGARGAQRAAVQGNVHHHES